jgi:hypothetical protein
MLSRSSTRCQSRALALPVRCAAFPTILALALLAGGCASTETTPSRVAGPMPMPNPETLSMKVEVEDDGLPSQLAPRHRRPEPDDPTQPWSPRYGTVKAQAPANMEPAPSLSRVAARVEATHPPISRGRPIHPDDIIRQAIAEHERLRQ